MDIAEARVEINQLLGLGPEKQGATVTYGLIAQCDSEIAMLTRSILKIKVNLTIQIDAPYENVHDVLTTPSSPMPTGEEVNLKQLIQVKSGSDKPDNTLTAIKCQDHRFWIDKRDFQSKRAFAFLMTLFSLIETGGKEGLPLITIPT